MLRHIRSFTLVLLVCAMAVAQCDPAWQPGDPVSMPRGNVAAMTTWDPDGTGPSPLVLVIVGSFVVGNHTAYVATWNGSQWSPLGTGLLAPQSAVVVYNGELVVAGDRKVHRWTGTAWLQFGSYAVSINSASIASMLVWNGSLYVAGRFDTFAGFTANHVARWNGTTWSPLGTGIASNGWVNALAVYQNVLYVGGSFQTAGSVATANLAIWNGTTWVATAGCNDYVLCLAVRIGMSTLNSYLFAGGAFTAVGSVPVAKVAVYHSITDTWSAMGSLASVSEPCRALFVRGIGINGYEVAAVQRERAWVWSGTAWNHLGPPLETAPPNIVGSRQIQSLGYYAGRYVVGLEDYWGQVGGVWSFDGANWQSLDGAGIDRAVHAVLSVGDDLVLGGAFRSISGTTMNGVAIGTEGNWQALGGGVTGGTGEVVALARLPNGDLVAAGTFSIATGGVADRIARWNGSAWVPMATGMNFTVSALAVLPNGDLIAGGSFSVAGGVPVKNLARWNGSAWSSYAGGCNGSVLALLALPNGDLVVGGSFLEVGSALLVVNRVARWSAGAWHAFAGGADASVLALASMPDGDVVIGGSFAMVGGMPASRVARWNGSAWQALSLPAANTQQTVRTLVALPNGDLMVGGTIFQDFGNCLLRLRDGQWSSPGIGAGVFGSSPDVVRAATVTGSGDVVVAGYFTQVTNLVAANVARLAVTCPASAVAYGTGCTGSAGPNTLVATSLPWQNGTFRSRATGMPANGVAVVVFGFAPIAVPVSLFLPEGLPGCDVLTTLEITAIGVPTAGVFDTEVFLSPSPSLVGVPLYHQIGAVEVNGSQISAISTTNGLALTVGSY